ncbi:MAG: 2-oxoglutarate dehydrogenase E1 component [Gemmatimonadetes bacterium]|nr:2-oxoglutarate dehydrogenase E1 component [Gemmatimonadota bacterium]
MSISSLFDGYNAGYAQELYEKYVRNPESVPPQWQTIFSRSLEELQAAGLLIPDALLLNGGMPRRAPVAATAERRLLPRIARATSLIQAFRDHGHQMARIDPLGSEPPGHPQLDPAFFGTSLGDLAAIPTSLVLEGSGDQPLSETLQRLRGIYCGSVGYQFEHLEDPEKVRWLWAEVESGRHAQPMRNAEKLRLLERLSQVEGLEHFLQRAYLGQKRFSIEGTDMLVPMLDLAIEGAAATGGKEVVLAMAHRGRLNVLTHIVGVESASLLREFEGTAQEGGGPTIGMPSTGDVKYHHGAQGEYGLRNGSRIRVTLAPNPSHLEFVNPVVAGMARALQFSGPGKVNRRDEASVVPLLIHGDAAFAAEGVVAESLNLARLEGFAVGGTVHLIVNNQVGFTTDPSDGRSTRYASDLAKGYDIPALHVNADDPEACLSAVRLAMAYRAKFRDDVLIDLVGYRRYGHNEGDEPSYTQPLLYRKIEGHPTVRARWADRLVSERIVTEDEARRRQDAVADTLRRAQEQVQQEQVQKDVPENGDAGPAPAPTPPVVSDLREPELSSVTTSVPLDVLFQVNRESLSIPDGFSVHPKLKRQLDRRRADFGPETRLDWAHAETLALGSLLLDGIPVRLTGQDTQRGTFSQRHLVLHDIETGARVMPLASVGRARLEVYNSPLSETAVLAFEYGYSVAAEEDFVLWEAQFGDFVNVAQVVVDQFIASGRTKWGQQSRLTLLLPHGSEGQGPEHSSARLERFLQIAAEDNIRVAYPSTPAQYFHLLRRQAHSTPPRPLIVMTPKSLLRLPEASSSARELADGVFHPVIADHTHPGETEEVTRLVFCSGKVFYDLVAAQGREALEHVSVGRIEQLYPFPMAEVAELVNRHPGTKELIWVQEEPRNMGALAYIGPLLRSVVSREIPLRHVARPERASPAEGRSRSYRISQERIVREGLGL